MPIPKESMSSLSKETLCCEQQQRMRDLYRSSIARTNGVGLHSLDHHASSSDYRSELRRDDLLATLRTAMNILQEGDDEDHSFKATQQSFPRTPRPMPRQDEGSQ